MNTSIPVSASEQNAGAVGRAEKTETGTMGAGAQGGNGGTVLPVGEDDAEALNAEFELSFVIAGR